MSFTKLIICTCLLCLGFTALEAQSSVKQIEVEVQETFAEHMGSIPSLRELIPVPPTDPEKRKTSKLLKQAPQNFPGRGKREVPFPDKQKIGPDPLRQTSFNRSNGITIEPTVNIEGLNGGSAPLDPTGEPGKDHYLQAINATVIGVYDKEGNIETSFNANTLWSSLGLSSAGDPIILWDQEAERWFFTEFPNPNFLLVAVSNTSDPLGGYEVWSFATPSFPDYPKYGIWGDYISVTTNEQGPGQLECYFLDRQALLAGESSVSMQRIQLPGSFNTEAGFFAATPVDWEGTNPPIGNPLILALNDSSWGNTPEDAIEMYEVNVNFTNPGNTTVSNTTIVTSPYDSYACADESGGFFACVPQGGPAGGLDGIPEIIMNKSSYRNFGTHESIVLNFMTDVDGNNLAGIRWVELRRTTGSTWEVYQEGTFSPNDGLHRYMGAIAMDGSGNIGLAYNVSSAEEFAGVRFTGRRNGDPLGEMTVEEYNVVDGLGTIFSNSRFGDYAHMAVDPVDNRTFWYTGEYAGQGGTTSRIISFSLGRDSIDLAPTVLVNPQNGPDLGNSETIEVMVRNEGLESVNSFDIGYIFEGGAPVSETVNTALAPQEEYTHTFTSTVDMSNVGEYDIVTFTSLATDLATFNDTLRSVISKQPRWDIGISTINGGDDTNCGESLNVTLSLTNYGTEVITSAKIDVDLNFNDFDDFDWTGTLPVGETVEVPVLITGMMEGTNVITAASSLPNGIMDERQGNDEFSKNVEVNTGFFKQVVLTIVTDNFPQETTWQLAKENGIIVTTGGPYTGQANTTINETFCLDPFSCYKFTIFDSGNNGICCSEGNGSYTLTLDGGTVLVSGGEFGSQRVESFCPEEECTIELELDISNVSITDAKDGVIMITATGGNAPYQYSIDGGSTFQDGNVFENLDPGDYMIVVKDANDCEVEATATVDTDINIATTDLDQNIAIKVLPNPTDGVFRIEATGIEQESVFLGLGMFDQNGKVIYESRIARYNGVYTGQLSLYAFPSGVYYLKIYDEHRKSLGRLIRIVKI